MRRVASLIILLVLSAGPGLPAEEQPNPSNRAGLSITLEPLGDSPAGVVVRLDFRFAVPDDIPPGVPLVISGTALQGGIPKHFRIALPPGERAALSTILTLLPGEAEIDARLMVPLEEEAPVVAGKASARFAIAPVNRVYVAGEAAGAEAIVAEGTLPEHAGAVRIRSPRRDIAPNLFIVEVDVKPPVRRVEFWVEGKKLMARNAPPYRAELDLGALPRRVEVRAIGYDAQGRYVDADAFIVNERALPLEAKITRTVTPDGVSHFRVSLQNSKGTAIRSVTFFAGARKIAEWSAPPYAIDVPAERLRGVEFVRVSAMDATNTEAADILYLEGERYTERIEVNLVELPLTVTGSDGKPVSDLRAEEVRVEESGKLQTISGFSRGTNLPLSLGLLIDHSGSMKKRMEATRKGAAEFLRSVIKPGDRAFVAGFSFDPSKTASFSNDAAVLALQAEGIGEAEGGTSLYDAIITGLYRFRSVQGQKALVILTDGEDTTSRTAYDDLLAYIRAARVPLYFVGIGMGISDVAGINRMKALAAETGGTVHLIRDPKQLRETCSQIEDALRSQYLVSYAARSGADDRAYRAVSVKIARPGVTVRTIRGYIP